MTKTKTGLGIFVLALSLATYLFLPDNCPEAARRCAGIVVFAAGFWALDVIPVYITSLLIVLLLCFTLAKPGGVLEMDRMGYTIFLAPFSSPILMLFFGGFVLAEGLKKNQCDKLLAFKILSLFSSGPNSFLLGIMISTALLSMWISNTAATVIMLGVLQTVFDGMQFPDLYRKGVLLSVPFSANIGGIATPIGTPPNALAIGFLSDYGIYISFSEWMLLCIPLTLILIFTEWCVLSFFYTSRERVVKIFLESPSILNQQGRLTLSVAFCTVGLWLTSPWHEIPEALIALLSAGTLMVLGLIDRNDIKKINWDILILMWGGLALGVGIEKTELGLWLVQEFLPHLQGVTLALSFAIVAFLLSLFISNTAAAALMIPIALEIVFQADRSVVAITIALMCSIAMIFPVSTPPNALAFGTGLIDNREMVKVGSVITFISFSIVLLAFWYI